MDVASTKDTKDEKLDKAAKDAKKDLTFKFKVLNLLLVHSIAS